MLLALNVWHGSTPHEYQGNMSRPPGIPMLDVIRQTEFGAQTLVSHQRKIIQTMVTRDNASLQLRYLPFVLCAKHNASQDHDSFEALCLQPGLIHDYPHCLKRAHIIAQGTIAPVNTAELHARVYLFGYVLAPTHRVLHFHHTRRTSRTGFRN